MQRINAWSSPRNISTALMYAFAQRADTSVVDEPLYAHYLHRTTTEAEHPAREAILQSQDHEGQRVLEQVIFGEYPTPVVLFKQMTHHLVDLPWDFLQKTDNVLLIRNPRAIIASYSKVIPNPSIEDVGIRKQFELYQYLAETTGPPPILDARELLLDPPGVLQQLCEKLGLAFDPAMLSWKPGPRPEDGVWATHWYRNVHRSTGFLPYREKQYQLQDELEQLAEECRPYYEALSRNAIKATSGTN